MKTVIILFTLSIILSGCRDDSEIIITDQKQKQETIIAPEIITAPITGISSKSAVGGGTIISDGKTDITAKGVCWNQLQYPALSDPHTVEEEGAGTFVSRISGLKPDTIYYVRAYATTRHDTYYGTQVSFRTLKSDDETANTPQVSTSQVTQITHNSAVSGGVVSDDRGYHVTSRGVCWNTSPKPRTGGSCTTDGQGEGKFTSRLTGIKPGTTYHVRAYAVNSEGTSYGNEITFTSHKKADPRPGVQETKPETDGMITDIDGNRYRTITIGGTEWMAQNLKTTRYNDGTIIPHVTEDSDWTAQTTGAWANYNNRPGNDPLYGKLYNGFAVTSPHGLCPSGWRIPDEEDWTNLENHLGGDSIAGGKMKSTRMAPERHPRWLSPNTGATNESGFTGYPGGYRFMDGTFYHAGAYGRWWSSSGIDELRRWYWSLDHDSATVYRYISDSRSGLSVRCVKDD